MATTWQKDIEIPTYGKLDRDLDTDAVIIGGGITGITCAYLLAKAGKSVVVLDKGSLDKSMTAFTTAFIANDIDTDLPDLVKIFGEKKAKDIWLSHSQAIDSIESIIKEHNIDCEFKRCSEYVFSTSKSGLKKLQNEADVAKSMGFDIKHFDQKDLPFEQKGGYELGDQAKFHPLKYLISLRKHAEYLGVVFYDHTEAKKIISGKKVKKNLIITNHGKISARYAVIATYLPIKNPPTIFAQKGMYISYLYELEIPHGTLPEGIYEDDMNPYHYIRVDAGRGEHKNDRMFVGGEDHRKELPISKSKNYRALKKYLKKHFPDLEYKIVTKWEGGILETIDGLAFIGVPSKKHPGMLVATGFSGNGMTYSMIAAEVISDHILGRKNKFAYLYDPYRRITAKSIYYKTRDYVQELFEGYMKNLFR